jgi:UDP-N-acetyl-D-mannosaminuronic acid dehydrogenase
MLGGMSFAYDVCVLGGCGHVGLPLAITLASELTVAIHDIDDAKVAMIREGKMPFLEADAEPLLRSVLERKTLHIANDPTLIGKARWLIISIGTPVDEHLNPKMHEVLGLIREIAPMLDDRQCIVLRSTLFPGTTEKVYELLKSCGKNVAVAFCPERIAEGKAIEELRTLPQIVSGFPERAIELARELFGRFAKSIITLTPLEAELTKIFGNSWRYIQFAIANQFLMIASDFGCDFYRIYEALTRDYPRMAGLPTAGFAAGPCLFKDTMQLAAAYQHNFQLGHAAMFVNEGLPAFIVRNLKSSHDLHEKVVGILGMAFKADSDDPRGSLSYKLRRLLQYEVKELLCTDPYIEDERFVPLEEVLARADVFVLGAPHHAYRQLDIPVEKPVIDIWNVFKRGTSL